MEKSKAIEPTSAPILNGNKFYRITNMPPEKLDAVRDLLKRGASAVTVAKQIQEWGFNTDIKVEVLAHMVNRYRKETIPAIEVLDIVDPHTATSIRNRALKNVNVLEEFSDMIRLQKTRIEMAMEKEKTLKMPMRVTEEAIATMGKLLKDYGELAFKVGIVSTMLDENSTGPRFVPRNMDQMLQNQELRTELVGVLDQILSEIDDTVQYLKAPK